MTDRITIKEGDHIFIDTQGLTEDIGCVLCGTPLQATSGACEGHLEQLYTIRPASEGDEDNYQRLTVNDPGENLPDADWKSMEEIAKEFNTSLLGSVTSASKTEFNWKTKDGSIWNLVQLEDQNWLLTKKLGAEAYSITRRSWPHALEMAMNGKWDDLEVES